MQIARFASFCLFVFATEPRMVFSNFSWTEVSCSAHGGQRVCYTVDHNATELTNADAAAECQRRHQDGRLAAILNAETQRDLVTKLERGAYWIGARLRRLPGWTWLDGSSDVSWFSIPGSKSGRYVKMSVKTNECQAEVIPAFDPQKTLLALCKQGGTGIYHAKQARTWHDARNKCLLDGGDLAMLQNGTCQQLSDQQIIQPNKIYYVGLRNAIFEWQGTSVNGFEEEVGYTNWAVGTPVDDQECVRLQTDLTGPGKWTTTECVQHHRFICEYAHLVSPLVLWYLVVGLGALSTCLLVGVVIIAARRVWKHCKTMANRQTESCTQIAVDNQTVADNMYDLIRVVDNTASAYVNISPEQNRIEDVLYDDCHLTKSK